MPIGGDKKEVRAAEDSDFHNVRQQDREYQQQYPWSCRHADSLEQAGQPAQCLVVQHDTEHDHQYGHDDDFCDPLGFQWHGQNRWISSVMR